MHRINGIVTLFSRDGIYTNRFVKVLGQRNLKSLYNLLFNQAFHEHNARIAEVNRHIAENNERLVVEEYRKYIQGNDDNNSKFGVILELDKNEFFRANFARLKPRMTDPQALLTLEDYKALCLTEGCEVLRLTKEQVHHLLLACFLRDQTL